MKHFNFMVSPPNGIMSIGNAQLKLTPSELVDLLPPTAADAAILAWRSDGTGIIERENGLRVLEEVKDLGQYQPLINAWIEAAAKLPEPLTVPQARQIKIDMVDGIYEEKRVEPLPHGTYLYDAADEAVTAMTAALSSGAGGLGSVDLSSLVTQINNNYVFARNKSQNWATVSVLETSVWRAATDMGNPEGP